MKPIRLLCLPWLCLALLSLQTAAQAQPLLTTSTVWRYLDDGSDQGTVWRGAGFNDSGWSNGVPLFGAETPGIYPWPIRTPMPVGGGRNTYYFRAHFARPEPWSSNDVLRATAFLDDGAVFYLNGVECGRVRLTNDPVLFDSLALNQGAEGTADVLTLSTASLVPGDNVLAVEVHQFTPGSSDAVFGITLDAQRPPVITQQPQSLTVTQGQAAAFSVSVAGTPPFTFQWRHSNSNRPPITRWDSNEVFALPSVQFTDVGDYDVIVSNTLGVVASAVATLTVVPDTFPPALASAAADCAGNKVTVRFSELVEASTAQESFNYTISGGISVHNAMLSPDGQTVCLFADPLSSGVTYTLTADGVQDLAGNTINPGSQINFQCAAVTPVITCASNKTVECGSAWDFDAPTIVSGGCGNSAAFSLITTVTNGACPMVITRTWSVTDVCTNSAECSQTVTVRDSMPPQLTCASNKLVVCVAGTNLPAYSVVTTIASATASGRFPRGKLTEGRDGRLFGTMSSGGSNNAGTIFAVNKDGSAYTVLRYLDNLFDGGLPVAGLTYDASGVLYGTTSAGGSNNAGTVFKLNSDGSGFAVLRSFTTNGADARNPQTTLLLGSDGALYGTADAGGDFNNGAVFKLNLNGSGYTILRSFNAAAGEGNGSAGDLIEGRDGLLYGTTESGPPNSRGVVFHISKNGLGFAVLHPFDSAGGDGNTIRGGVIEGPDAKLCGVTYEGGTNNAGVVFGITRDGSGFQVFHHFLTNGIDGVNPRGSLTLGADGHVCGVTELGGSEGRGTVYRLNPGGSGITIVRSFSSAATDRGLRPQAGLLLASDGALYGTTQNGGSGNNGLLYKLDSPCPWTFDPPTVSDACCSNVTVSVLSTVTSGSNPLTVTRTWQATDCCSNTATCSQTVTVGNPPVIFAQPQSLTVTQGQTATFSVAVSGTPTLSYQWFKWLDTEVPIDEVATTATYTVLNAQSTNAGLYTVVVSNAFGSATSQVAVLTVVPLPVLFAGLEHRASGGASTSKEAGGLVVGNIGSSGEDGVSMKLGAADGWLGRFDPPVNPSGTGVVFRSAIKGGKGGMNNQDVGEMEFAGKGDGFSANFSFPGATGAMTVEMFDTNGATIFKLPLPWDNRLVIGGGGGGAVSSIQWLASPDPGLVLTPSGFAIKEQGIKAMLGLGGGASVGGFGMPTVPGVAAILVEVNETNAVPDFLSEVSLKGGGLGSFKLKEEGLAKLGMLHQAKGDATILGLQDGGTNKLRVANLGVPGDADSDGVTMQAGPVTSISASWKKLGPMGPLADGAYVESSALGGTNGQQVLASTRATQSGSNVVITLGLPLGTPHWVRLLSNGVVVAERTNQTGMVATTTVWPDGGGHETRRFIDIEVGACVWTWDHPVRVVSDGVDNDCDGVMFGPLGGTGSEEMKGMELTGSKIDSIEIEKTKGTPATYPPVIKHSPESQTVCVGSPVTFMVNAASQNPKVSSQGNPPPPLTYQWKKDGGIISGATLSTHTIPNPQLSDSGLYTVTVSEGGLDATSDPATLTVIGCGRIRGKVFSAENFDCVPDPQEIGLIKWGVLVNPGSMYALTDAQGSYSINVPPGAYTVSAAPNFFNWAQVCPVSPPTHPANISIGVNLLRNFAFLPPSGVNCPNLWVSVTAKYPGAKLVHIRGPATPCCGADYNYYINYGNNGSQPLSGAQILFVYPAAPICSIVSVTPGCGPVSSLASLPGLELFSVPTLAPNAQCVIRVKVHLDCDITEPCPTQIGLSAEAFILPLAGDCDTANNYASHSVKPCCSYDPNDCTVTPKGCGPEGLVHRDQAMTYEVDFQNLGGGPAHTVLVRDLLDADLDMGTLEILGSSHDYVLERSGRELLWIFPDIELAPVSQNEEGSHGYVKFRIHPRADAPAGTVITNSAEIRFDINESITTITTTNTITEDPVPKAAFTVAPQAGSAGMTNNFAYTGGTFGAAVEWDFGPGAEPRVSTQLNPTGVIFAQPGRQLVTLRARLGDCEAEPAVRMLTVGRPQLAIIRTAGGVGLSWSGDGLRLQLTSSLTAPIQWNNVAGPAPTGVGGWYFVELPEPGVAQFYRLEQVP